MKKLNTDQPTSLPMFNQSSFFILLFTLILVFLLPNFSLQESTGLHFFLFSLSSFILFLLYLFAVLRRRQFFLGSTPLFWPLLSLLIVFFITIFSKQSFPSLFHFLSYAGLFINFIIISLLSNTLIKKNNGLIVVNILIIFASITTLLSFLQLLSITLSQQIPFFSLLPQFSFYPQLSLILLGLTSILALFFKKGKLNRKLYFFLLPFLFLGLVATILNRFLFSSELLNIISFKDNLNSILTGLINTQRFNFFYFFLGQPHQTVANFYYQFSSSSFFSSFSTSWQSYNFPLFLQSQFGFLSLLAWLFFFFRTFQLSFFSHDKEYNYLFFILFVSCCLQLFIPVSPLIFLIQALIIAFASDKNKQFLFHFNFSAIDVHLDKKTKPSLQNKAIKKKSSHFLLHLSLIFLFFLNLSSFTYVSKSYFSYFLIAKTLSTSNLSLEDFVQKTTLAQRISPSLDYFCRLAAIAKLEETITLIKNDPQQTQLTQEKILAQKSLSLINQAIRLDPKNAINYRTKATIYQELAPYSQDNSDLFNQEILTAYSQAILLQPRNPELYLELASFYLSNSQIEIALNLTQEALKINSNYLPGIYQLAQIYQLQKQPLLAQTTYQQAKSLLDPQSSNYQSNLQIIEQNLQQLSVVNQSI